MGCANSKQNKLSHRISYYSPGHSRISKHVVHPPQSKDEKNHVVELKSTTLGSMEKTSHYNNGFIKFSNDNSDTFKTQNEDVVEEAKVFSNLIEQKLAKAINVPKSSIITPSPCEAEIINTWELMEGLEDTPNPLGSPIHLRSFSFDINNVSNHVAVEIDPRRRGRSFAETALYKPFWLHDESISNLKPDLDDNVISSLLQNGNDGDSVKDFKAGGKMVVFYFTSLRGVRKTFEDCCHVKTILKELGVKIDERDLSMDLGFKEELKELLGDGFEKGSALLPRVFIGRNHIGGLEEIQKLHEDGKLEKLFDCCEKIDDNDDVCEACGEIRFVLCETCNGSCKIYGQEKEEEEAQDCEVGQYGFRKCPHCNENGLIRCPICCHHYSI